MHTRHLLRPCLRLGGFALIILAFAAWTPVAVQAQSYAVTDMGILTGGTGSYGLGVNDSGQVTGYADTNPTGSASNYHAFLSSLSRPGGAVLEAGDDMGTLAGSFSVGFGINASGQVTGYSDTDPTGNAPAYHAFLSGPDGLGLTDLGTLTGGSYSYGFGINASGQVAGYSDTTSGNTRAFLSGPDGVGLTDLGTLGGANSYGLGVNDSGQVTGYADATGGNTHAFLSGPNGFGMNDLGTLPDGSFSYGAAVNISGQVTGYADTTGGALHAFLSGPDGAGLTAANDLGSLPGDTESFAQSVNDSGQVVGYSDTFIASVGSVNPHAFVFTNGVMTDLNSLIAPGSGFTLTYAYGISNTGFITGFGTNSSNQTEAFLLTPTAPVVPEASSTVSLGLLLALGLGSAIIAAHKRQGVKV